MHKPSPASGQLAEIADRIRSAPRVTVLSGAGMSAESGVPTFREAQTGLWAKFSPEELATPEAFAADAQRVMDWYRWRCEIVARALPNAGHMAIARAQHRGLALSVVTQNVDGLHQRAWRETRGADSHDSTSHPDATVVELHGRLSHLRCERCGECQPWPAPDDGGLLAHRCGGRLRPDIVWFGEALPEAGWAEAERLVRGAGVLLVVGTSGLVYPAAGLPAMARRSGAYVVEVNPQRTPLSDDCDAWLAATAAEALPRLLAATTP